jgi:arabinofuranan 3-O-arabinosyltransferase
VPDRPSTDHADARRSIERFRLFAICLGLALLVFRQRAGFVAADTKLDLLVDPLRFLNKSVSMWDSTANAGQLQDQAYGYLFPMGPFFVLGKWMHLDPWVVQRSWESLLVVAAFVGTFKLARAVGVKAFWPAVGAGLAYGLAPRVLSELFVISAELLPLAALPFVLLPLGRGVNSCSPRRSACRSGVALLFAGGINASATIAILPVPVIWLFCQPRGKQRAALVRWWCLAVVCASIWWLVPLFVLGKFSPPFLDWIESSAVTTSPTSLINTLRGVDHWQSFLGASEWPGAWILASSVASIVATCAVAAIGLAGLARNQGHVRYFLLLVLLVGVCLVTAGHVSSLSSSFTPAVRTMLDGTLNAFRNVHKFDPLVRLPISIGFGFALAALAEVEAWRLFGRLRSVVLPQWLPVIGVLCFGVVAIAPAMTNQLVPRSRQTADPVWWNQVAGWLHQQPSRGRTLVLPGAAQPAYFWGSPRDDALQPYAESPWTVRDAAPLAQPGYVRLLDQLEYRFASGRYDGTLSDLLARSGIQFVLMRNDLATSGSRAAAIHSTIDRSPGFTAVAGFGPNVGGSDDPDRLVDSGLSRARPAVEVFSVDQAVARADLIAADAAVTSNGSADNLSSLLDRGLTTNNPVFFNSDGAGIGGPAFVVETDGLRRRESAFSNIATQSETMTAQQPYRATRAAHDYLPSPQPAFSTVSYSGFVNVEASSSASSPSAFLNAGAGTGPFAAIDGDSTTSWRSSSLSGAAGQWLQIDLLRDTKIASFSLTFAPKMSAYPTLIRVSTDSSSQDVAVVPDSLAQPVNVGATTKTLRITVLAVTNDRPGQTTGIANLTIPGVSPSRWVDVPEGGTPNVIAFDQTVGERGECLAVGHMTVCDPELAVAGEESSGIRREFGIGAPTVYSVAATIRLRSGAGLTKLLDQRSPAIVTASSTDSSAAEGRPGAVLDGSDKTAWVAATGDRVPRLDIKLRKPARIASVAIRSAASGPYASPTRVAVEVGRESWTGTLADDGVVHLAHPVKTDHLSVTILEAAVRTNTDSRTGVTNLLPAGISEISIAGVTDRLPSSSRVIDLTCNDGLRIRLDAKDIPLHATASIDDLVEGKPVLAVPCGTDQFKLGSGEHRVQVASISLAETASVTLSSLTASPRFGVSAEPGSMQMLQWGDTKRRLKVVATTKPALLVVHENANAGWRGSLNGKDLVAVRVDGWQQAWLVPAGADGVVTLTFQPQRAVVIGLLIGCGLVAALLVMALWPAPPTQPTRNTDLSTHGRGQTTLLVVSAIALSVTAGVVGLVLAALMFGAMFMAPARATGRVRRWLPGSLLIVAALWLAITARPANESSLGAVPQVLCAGAISCLVTADRRRMPRDQRLSKGRSNK